MAEKIHHFRELRVYRDAFATAATVEKLTEKYPEKEKWRLIDQSIRASRSVCSSLAEAWRKRRYPNAFIAKLNDAEAEASEMQCWLEFALEKKYINEGLFNELDDRYEHIIRRLSLMAQNVERWKI